MLKYVALAGLIALMGSAAVAQGPSAPAASLPSCGVNGYARPAYGVFGDNDGVAHAYEVAGTCTPQAVKDAAEAVGMGRTRPLGLKSITTILYSATGTLSIGGKAPVKIDKLNVQLNYMLPAARVAVTTGGDKPTTAITVFNDTLGWTERQEGVFLAAAPKAVADLAPLYKLSPFGALTALVEAEGNAKVSTVGGKTVISGASPYDGIPVTVTLDEANLPVSVTAKINKHIYVASYGAFIDTLESKQLVVFPSKMVVTMDGKPYADLTSTDFKSNPYVVFPVPVELPHPATVAAASPPPAPADGWAPPARRIDPADAFFQQAKSSLPTPRLADGHPDLNGQWNGGFSSPAEPYALRRRGTFEPDQFVLQKGSYRNKPIYKPEYWQKVRDLDFSKVDVDPVFRCFAAGVPRQGAPLRIIQTPKELWTMNVAYAGASVRVVPTDGRARPESDSDYSFALGMPLGHWDGDTMLIESVGFNDATWLNWAGYFHTAAMKVTERLRRQGDLLFYQFTVDDPEVLAEPWTTETFVRRLNPDPLAVPEKSDECTENDLGSIIDLYMRG